MRNGDPTMKLTLGLPKGSLQESTFELFRKAGYNIKVSGRSYFPTIDDPEISVILLRAQEMSFFVEQGVLDAGVTGKDWIEENDSTVHEVAELVYAKSGFTPVRWVLAVPEDSPIQSVKDLEGKRIATEAVNLTSRFLAKNKVKADVKFSWGATEVKVPTLVDAIVELTETGSSLAAHNLRIVETVMTSTTRFIANTAAWDDAWKRRKIENIAMLLNGALNAEQKVGVKMNLLRGKLDEVTSLIPALRDPTVSSLTQEGWVAIEVIVDEKVIRDLIPKLKAAGAEGIIEYPLNKVIY
jgi:ATP phosphoribosyltransferase